MSQQPRAEPRDLEAGDDGPRICICMKVHAGTLRRAIEAGARTLEELSSQTRAGTGCGTCRMELLEFLAARDIEES